MNKFKRIKVQFVWAMIFPIVFIVVGLFMKGFFEENIIPSDYPLVQPDEWADIFFNVYIGSSIVCLILNALIVPLMIAYTKFNTKMSWLYFAILNLILMLIGPVYISTNYPANASGSAIGYLMFIFEYILTYFISTYFGPIGFCPYKSTKIRNK